MSKLNRVCFLALSFIAVVLPWPAQATTLSAPKDKPLFSLEVPSGWEDAASMFSQYDVALMRDGQLLYITRVAALGLTTEVTADNAKTAVCDFAKQGEGATCKETKEMEIAGHPAYSVESSGKYPQEIAFFTPDGKTWFAAVAGQNNIGKIGPVLKAIKSKGGDDEE